jgi:sulfur-oxidizing protein SoxY
MKTSLLALVFCGALAFAPLAAQATESDTERAQRWQELAQSIFGDKPIADGAGLIRLDAPPRALDAALVPVTVTLARDKPVKGVYLVIDDNPAPLAAHVTFGPAADPGVLKFRVRVDQYTLMHAVAETADGQLYEAVKFVKAAGGCSAPVGADATAALEEIGRMKLRLPENFALGQPAEAQLMIRHPNFNGMQMDQLTRNYTPARFIRTVDVTYNGEQVFHLDGDISLSTDPAIGFGFVPKEKGRMKVIARDSDNAVFEHSFDVPPQGS